MPTNLPLTYPDLVCLDDLDPFAGETASDLQSLGQDLYHVLVQLPNSNPDDPDRGIGVMQYLSCTETQFRSLGGKIDKQFEEDSRVVSSKTTLSTSPDGSFVVNVEVKTANGIIPLQYAVSGGGVTHL